MEGAVQGINGPHLLVCELKVQLAICCYPLRLGGPRDYCLPSTRTNASIMHHLQ